MKAMLAAFVAIVVIAFGVNFILENAGFSTEDRASGADVSLNN